MSSGLMLGEIGALPFTFLSFCYLCARANCCIYLGRDKHYYSVPYQHIGKTAHVAYTRTLVKIYVDGTLVATHQRDYRPVNDWYDVMKGNTTAADAILDRLVHTSVRFELKEDSMRRKKQQKSINSEKND